MPEISIIVPVYNKKTYIANTLESILMQTYEDYEVIVIDDGSTDGSLDIIKKYEKRDKRIGRLSISNGGVSNARNVGIEKAEGNWIQFLDGDDLIEKDYLERGIKIVKEKGADILFTNFEMINEKKEVIRTVGCSYQGIADPKRISQLFMELQYKNGFFGYISNKLIKRTLIEKAKAKFKTELDLAEDLDFYVQIYPFLEKAVFAKINSFEYLQTESNYLWKENIDYQKQMMIHLEIRKWFIEKEFYVDYKELLDKKVAEYIFFSLFYAEASSSNLKKEYERIVKNKEAMECIELRKFSGFQRGVLKAVKSRKYNEIYLLLKSREYIKKICGRLKGEESVFIQSWRK